MNQTSQLMPMQLGEQAMAQQMQQMSQGQETIAGDIGDLANEKLCSVADFLRSAPW